MQVKKHVQYTFKVKSMKWADSQKLSTSQALSHVSVVAAAGGPGSPLSF